HPYHIRDHVVDYCPLSIFIMKPQVEDQHELENQINEALEYSDDEGDPLDDMIKDLDIATIITPNNLDPKEYKLDVFLMSNDVLYELIYVKPEDILSELPPSRDSQHLNTFISCVPYDLIFSLPNTHALIRVPNFVMPPKFYMLSLNVRLLFIMICINL